MTKLIALVFLVLGFIVQPLHAVETLKQGNIILFRHANAPGVGDPPNFQVTDCSTQRNLDEIGRALRNGVDVKKRLRLRFRI
jgi:hypothetical protein